MTRAALRRVFLASSGWGDANAVPLAGDASGRRYERLHQGSVGSSVILMDSPRDTAGDTLPFLKIAEHLANCGLSSPRVLSKDTDNGFILLEDLGDDIFARVVEREPSGELMLYQAAVDVLVDLHTHAVPDGLPRFGVEEMAASVDLAVTRYLPGCGEPKSDTAVSQLKSGVLSTLRSVPSGPQVLALRDYHAENLIWLPERRGSARVGLLDFQDAFAGHPAYDVVSLLEDARRDVSPDVAAAMVERYIRLSGIDGPAFRQAIAAHGAQRNLRILGVFARLCMHFGKVQYVDLIPRVWRHLCNDLSHPDLTELKYLVQAMLPAPTPERLERIKDKCGKYPKL